MRRTWIPIILLALLPLSAMANDGNESATPSATAESGMLGQAQEIVLRALSFIGVRYNYVFNQATGKSLPGNAREISQVGASIDRTELQPGDLVFFNTLRRPFSHVGIYLGDSRFVHAPSRGGKVEIVDMSDRYWQTRYNGARRLAI